MHSFTHHARSRLRQRAIPEAVVELLFDYGKYSKAGWGASKVYFDKPTRNSVWEKQSDELGGEAKYLNCYLVIDKQDCVITAGYRTKRIVRN